MKWKTKISTSKNGDMYVRGERLLDLAEDHSFTEAVFLLLKGTLPNKKEAAMLDTILVASVEHGVEAPSAFVARTTASTGNSLNVAVAAGILNIGDWHGGAIEQCAELLQSSADAKTIVETALKNGERIPGLGHKVYKDIDPRAVAIFTKAKELGLYGKYSQKAEEIGVLLKSHGGKMLPLNIDGAIAAVISELGFDWKLGKAFFILGRLPGLIAHVYEEMTEEKPYRRLDSEDVEYIGPEII